MNTLRLHYIQHVPFEGLGYIETWARLNCHTLTSTKLYEKVCFPEMEHFDWLIIMGGPMGVYDESIFPWLKEEKKFIKKAVDYGKTVIGICLGSQLIAEVLGAKVYPNKKKEIGWFPVSLTQVSKQEILVQDFIDSIEVLHWHGDTFDLPKKSKHLLQTEICKNQAFLYNDRVLGLQFHLEATPESLKGMIENCGKELVAGELIQTEEEIIRKEHLCTQTNEILIRLLNKLANKNQE